MIDMKGKTAVEVALEFLGVAAGGARIDELARLLIHRDEVAENRGYNRGVRACVEACNATGEIYVQSRDVHDQCTAFGAEECAVACGLMLLRGDE